MRKLGTLWRTLRHLKVRQLVGRAVFHLRRPAPDLSPAPPRRALAGHWVLPARRAASLEGPGLLRLLNTEYRLDVEGWDQPSVDRLLRYNAHYFDDLAAFESASRDAWQRALLEQWLMANPPAIGTGWEPYPTSLRIVNWVKWFMGGVDPAPAWLHSLAVQARQVAARTEWHLLGNHLLVNAKALLFAGCFFEGPEADAWRAQGLAILAEQLPEQVLADGAQFELSPMYHALALEDVLDLVNVTRSLAPPAQQASWVPTAARMLYWMRCLSHPDGGLASFNDGSPGVAPSAGELERYARELGVEAPQPRPGVTLLESSGYARVAFDGGVALLDVARVGPDYLPAHAHADTLSFEMSLGMRRLLVNGGTSVYGTSRRRQVERGTAAHNTVQVGETDSSEVWGGFRVGRRAYPRELQVSGDTISCAHDGYAHLRGSPVHRRQWTFGASSLRVDDRVAPGQWPARARYHLAPGLRFTAAAPGVFDVVESATALARVEVRRGAGRVVPGTRAVGFNRLADSECLVVELADGEASTIWSWHRA